MLYGIILGILIGMVWWPSIEFLMMLFDTKSIKEFEDMLEDFKDNCATNIFMKIILFAIRWPLLVFLIPLFIHVYKLYEKES